MVIQLLKAHFLWGHLVVHFKCNLIFIIYFREKTEQIRLLQHQLKQAKNPCEESRPEPKIRPKVAFEELPVRTRRRYCEPLQKEIRKMAEKLNCDTNQMIGHFLTWLESIKVENKVLTSIT